MQGWWGMKLLANGVHVKGVEVLLAEKVHKQEPQCKGLYVSHNHHYIHCKQQNNVVCAMPLLLMQRWLCETHSHLCCGSCSFTLWLVLQVYRHYTFVSVHTLKAYCSHSVCSLVCMSVFVCLFVILYSFCICWKVIANQKLQCI